jgi:dihydroorotate dehydrogenase/Pyruvate/2-oxoacid:ferredoxin oxidoreductase delta subunit
MAQMAVEVFGHAFRNPVIPAAGPNVGTGEQIARTARGGAGGLLAKTISVRAAEVPRPDMYRYGSGAMLNTELWSELTPEDWFEREYDIALAAAREHGLPLIASLGYSADDLRALGPKVQAKGIDLIEFSIHYLDPRHLAETARALRESVSIPIIAKLSPHYGDLGEVARILDPYVDGFACINSFGPTLAIDLERAEPVLGSKFGYGWISGPPLKPLAVRSVFEVARVSDKPIIGVGGVSRGEDLIEFFMAGASLVGVCTAALLKGQSVYGRIAQEASNWLDKHGYRDVREVQGLYLKKYGQGQRVVTQTEEWPRVDAERCTGCTLCEKVCFYDAITAPPKVVARVKADLCFQCGLCVSVCSFGALAFQPRDQVTRLTIQ